MSAVYMGIGYREAQAERVVEADCRVQVTLASMN